MPSLLIYSFALSRGLPLNGSLSSLSALQNFGQLKKLFLARFFEDDTKVVMLTLLVTKQKKGESIKAFVERFWSMTLRFPSGMSLSTLVETCYYSLLTALLTQIRVSECRTWKQLVQQGEQAEEIVTLVKVEEKGSKPRPDKLM